MVSAPPLLGSGIRSAAEWCPRLGRPRHSPRSGTGRTPDGTPSPVRARSNRRHFHERLQAEVARAEREGRALSLILFDVDDFKSINDGYGHPAGDAALRGFAALLRDEARVSDVVCRVGGEELLRVADVRLLAAKAAGKDRVECGLAPVA